jgi:hypothetical protein
MYCGIPRKKMSGRRHDKQWTRNFMKTRQRGGQDKRSPIQVMESSHQNYKMICGKNHPPNKKTNSKIERKKKKKFFLPCAHGCTISGNI